MFCICICARGRPYHPLPRTPLLDNLGSADMASFLSIGCNDDEPIPGQQFRPPGPSAGGLNLITKKKFRPPRVGPVPSIHRHLDDTKSRGNRNWNGNVVRTTAGHPEEGGGTSPLSRALVKKRKGSAHPLVRSVRSDHRRGMDEHEGGHLAM